MNEFVGRYIPHDDLSGDGVAAHAALVSECNDPRATPASITKLLASPLLKEWSVDTAFFMATRKSRLDLLEVIRRDRRLSYSGVQRACRLVYNNDQSNCSEFFKRHYMFHWRLLQFELVLPFFFIFLVIYVILVVHW